MSQKTSERRRYFRVDDHIGLRLMLVTDTDVEHLDSGSVQTPEQRLIKVNSAINRHLARLKRKDESLATLLGLLNHKIDLIAADVDTGKPKVDDKHAHTYMMCEANVSACGLAFPYHTDFSKAQMLSLHIKLFPSEEVVEALAMVVGCERRDAFSAELSDYEKQQLKDRPYWVRVNFEEISEVEQELLAQHVIQKQASKLSTRVKLKEE
ncbi:hypothetical protein A3762_00450 [Oleiphilus sp. HI0125]|uniref:hypothetical protein n=1 Tax=Oleiphilus sp. HI0125 TaxID=1822266 RepID=UPI0007C30FAC|nr:hypothetical protein [Oleiphilus sp. HI0125]KZZ59486.1 hypothetical protein A3762_00450 [Oleiphilus sp. HI0125]